MTDDGHAVGGAETDTVETRGDGHAVETTRGDDNTVAVIGGGAVGVTAARELATAGLSVTLYEAGGIGSGASGRAAGVLYDAYAEDVDAALGARSIELFREAADRADRSDRRTARTGCGEPSTDDGPSNPFGFSECPYVICVRDGDDRRAEALRRSADRMRSHGRRVERIDGATLGERFPALDASDVAVAAVTRDAGYADTGAYTAHVASRAREAGVRIHTETPVVPRTDPVGVRRLRHDAPDESASIRAVTADAADTEGYDAVLVAAGAHTPRLLDAAGLGVAVVPYRVQALTARLDCDDPTTTLPTNNATTTDGTTNNETTTDGTTATTATYDAPMTYDATAGVYVRPHPTGLLAGDGTIPEPADPDDYDRTADDWFRTETRETVAARLDREVTIDRAWAGVCTATPDGDPMLGRRAPGVYVAAGWQGHGFMRSPAHAELAAACIARDLGVPADRRTPVAAIPGGETALEAFDPTRHPPDASFEIREGMIVD